MSRRLASLGIAWAQDVSEGAVLWDKIVSIELIGREHVYDIEVERTHNFIGNNIFAHNTYLKPTHAPESHLEAPAEGGTAEQEPRTLRRGEVVYGYFMPETGKIVIDIEKAKEAFREVALGLDWSDKHKVTGFVHAHEIFHQLEQLAGLEESESLADIFARRALGLETNGSEEQALNEFADRVRAKVTNGLLQKEVGEGIVRQLNLPYFTTKPTELGETDFFLNLHRLGVNLYNIEAGPIATLPQGAKALARVKPIPPEPFESLMKRAMQRAREDDFAAVWELLREAGKRTNRPRDIERIKRLQRFLTHAHAHRISAIPNTLVSLSPYLPPERAKEEREKIWQQAVSWRETIEEDRPNLTPDQFNALYDSFKGHLSEREFHLQEIKDGKRMELEGYDALFVQLIFFEISMNPRVRPEVARMAEKAYYEVSRNYVIENEFLEDEWLGVRAYIDTAVKELKGKIKRALKKNSVKALEELIFTRHKVTIKFPDKNLYLETRQFITIEALSSLLEEALDPAKIDVEGAKRIIDLIIVSFYLKPALVLKALQDAADSLKLSFDELLDERLKEQVLPNFSDSVETLKKMNREPSRALEIAEALARAKPKPPDSFESLMEGALQRALEDDFLAVRELLIKARAKTSRPVDIERINRFLRLLNNVEQAGEGCATLVPCAYYVTMDPELMKEHRKKMYETAVSGFKEIKKRQFTPDSFRELCRLLLNRLKERADFAERILAGEIEVLRDEFPFNTRLAIFLIAISPGINPEMANIAEGTFRSISKISGPEYKLLERQWKEDHAQVEEVIKVCKDKIENALATLDRDGLTRLLGFIFTKAKVSVPAPGNSVLTQMFEWSPTIEALDSLLREALYEEKDYEKAYRVIDLIIVAFDVKPNLALKALQDAAGVLRISLQELLNERLDEQKSNIANNQIWVLPKFPNYVQAVIKQIPSPPPATMGGALGPMIDGKMYDKAMGELRYAYKMRNEGPEHAKAWEDSVEIVIDRQTTPNGKAFAAYLKKEDPELYSIVSSAVVKPESAPVRGREIATRQAETVEVFGSVNRKADTVMAVIGVSTEIGETKVQQTIREINRGLARNGFGSIEDTHQVITFEIDVNNPEKTKENYERAMVNAHKDLPQNGRIVLFAPEMPDDGPKLANDAKGQYKEAYITVIPDAYSDSRPSENEYTDIDIRVALARHVAFYYNGNDQTSAIRAINKLLEKVAENAAISTIDQLLSILNPLKIRPLVFADIAQWQEMQKATATSL